MGSLLFGLISLLTVQLTVTEGHVVRTRSVIELVGMLRCSTGRSISYLTYGCYCGIGGRGWPRDKTDWCCYTHDCCYGKAEDIGCHPKTDSYSWSCRYFTPRCGNIYDECEKMICDCDVQLSKCLKKAVYQRKYSFWPNFLCGRYRPSCSNF
ncbi:phospholipase A2-like isoform X2 [Callorhinchus milii]|uniref:Phospholipase A2 n=1 Tax=Callorhinchus milii TaxID=7868 RepID=V9LCE5_CALMI|nr:phospholipase A2-like isoform X2 [Callorhinchus milii]XP_007909725.2 phospholipase A2-like isoform X2 [Callorhinchus milii]XP_007909726.2 phospholipase A2-like isoform X2 [Callorhinchus milii]XP_042197181.1 phospholipase A2-like isoform X2 [Callorhinchus milii]XP_042197183.1 phospholipase A2-like isoform X2 [Callorhinchus milii]XP_042197184.1 phospholipase A2-like isoform X2 [Callorhinchus milii]XP_042197185.1 phospholipase A2-like isoform X2 [Callorhinchus milii]